MTQPDKLSVNNSVNTINPCNCGNPKMQIQQFGACPVEFSVECAWNKGGCGKQGAWRYDENKAIEIWNNKGLLNG